MGDDKLLEKIRNTKAGWSDREIFKLLSSFGFVSREKKHTVYSHPEHEDLNLVVPRAKELKKVYPREVEKLIDRLRERSDES